MDSREKSVNLTPKETKHLLLSTRVAVGRNAMSSYSVNGQFKQKGAGNKAKPTLKESWGEKLNI